MKSKNATSGNTAANLYVQFADVREALPYFIRANYSKTQLMRQKYNSEFYLPFYRAPHHHSPPYWIVEDLVRWFLNFPLPSEDHDNFARELRARATATPPMQPTRPSGAGNYPRDDESVAYRARRAELFGKATTGWVPASQRARKSLRQ